MSISSRRISAELSAKAQTYLQKVAKSDKPDTYYYDLELNSSGMDEGLHLDALIQVAPNSLAILKIWELTYDSSTRKYVALNRNGEKGTHAKVLAEKYLNRFLDYVEAVDIDACTDKDIVITPKLVEKIEFEIDRRLQCFEITDSYVREYETFELIEFSLASLRHCLNNIGLTDYNVLYDKGSSTFEISVLDNMRNVKKLYIPMIDVIRGKQATGQSMFKVQAECLGNAIINAGLCSK